MEHVPFVPATGPYSCGPGVQVKGGLGMVLSPGGGIKDTYQSVAPYGRPALSVLGAEDSGTVRLSRGILVAVEGIDGAGKTTQARLLARRLSDAGLSVVETKEPTEGPHGRRLRASATSGRLRREEELQTFLDDRKWHVEHRIAPALAAGQVVIVDRYYFSTAAYQGARGFDPDAIIAVNEGFAPKPHLLLLLDIPVDEAMRRIGVRENDNGGTNSFEKRSTLQKCAAIFRRLERPELLRIDGRRPVQEIHDETIAALDRGALFRAACYKEYLASCEPEDCSYRIQRQCDYPLLGTLRRPSPLSAEVANSIATDASLTPGEKLDRFVAMLRDATR